MYPNGNRRPWTVGLSLFLVALCALPLLSAEIAAQSPQVVSQPLQLWVDPHDGDDAQASALNPHSTISAGCTSPPAPNPMAVLPDPNFGLLMHAPYPFKTVTGAVNYLNSIFTTGLPFYNGIVGPVGQQYDVTVTHAIIHCLPGKYSRLTSQDPHTRLFGNGETYPIQLPNRVCIQGTSALNTVFYLEKLPDAEGDVAEGPAFRFGSSPATRGIETTIDSISIFGAPSSSNHSTTPSPDYFSAIHLDPTNASSPTLTNCFIFACGIGVLVDAPDMVSSFHEPVLVNNTLADNNVSVWNGQTARGNSSVGVSRLILINNILEGRFNIQTRPWNVPPLLYVPPQWPPSGVRTACFEGVDAGDLQIAGFNPPTNTNGDFNAYELNRYDNPNAGHPALNLPITVVRGTPPAQPGIDIGPITGGLTFTPAARDRGVLYIRDCLFNGSLTVGTTSGPFVANLPSAPDLDRSPGDFRLCPDTAPATVVNQGPPTTGLPPIAPGNTMSGGARNLLVDRGWNGNFPVTMVNGRTLSAPPGQKFPEGVAPWLFNSWNTDCEGFGNARIFDHPKYNPSNPSAGSTIDIGADELGSNIAVGYRFGTTIFMSLEEPPEQLPSGWNLVKNKFVWFFGPANDSGGSVPGPYASYTEGWQKGFMPLMPHYDSWDPNPAPVGNYYDPEIVDIHPHLLPDIHPWWGVWLGAKPTNPNWFHSACSAQQQPQFYNPSLFNFPAVGHINPPGSTDNTAAPSNFYWLEEGNPYVPITLGNKPMTNTRNTNPIWAGSHNFDGSSIAQQQMFRGPGSLQQFGTWCQNIWNQTVFTDHETWLPTFAYKGAMPPYTSFRYSTEFKIGRPPPYGASSQASNLQSFMVLVEGEEEE